MSPLPLRGATSLQVEDALADAFAAFARTTGRASAIHTFASLAKDAGVVHHLGAHHERLLQFGVDEGLFYPDAVQKLDLASIASKATATSLSQAEFAVKLASAVLLHAAFEEYLVAICRIGAASFRQRMLEWVGAQQVQVRELQKSSPDELADRAIESWLKKFERDTVLEKWDRFIGLFGHPSNLTSGPWHFDRDALVAFDSARHNGVHGDGTALTLFDMRTFQTQLSRASLAMLFHATKGLGLKLNPARIFLGPDWRKTYRPSTPPTQ
jgi:hypothetical protein